MKERYVRFFVENFKNNDLIDDQIEFFKQLSKELRIQREDLPFYFDGSDLIYEETNDVILNNAFEKTYAELKKIIVNFLKKSSVEPINWSEVNRFTRSLWDQNISEYNVDRKEIESALFKIKKGAVLLGDTPREIKVEFVSGKFNYYFDDELELTTSNIEEVAAYLIIFADENGDPNDFLK